MDKATKLHQYYKPSPSPSDTQRFSQPGFGFTKAVRVIDFRQIHLLPIEELLVDILGFNDDDIKVELAAYKAAALESLLKVQGL
jgi:hypothetical protein